MWHDGKEGAAERVLKWETWKEPSHFEKNLGGSGMLPQKMFEFLKL